MPKATFRFYEELNDYLPKNKRKTDFEVVFSGGKAVKDFIEELNVPRAEIDLILANKKSVDFNYIVQDGDRISVYPVFESLNIENITRLRKKPLRKIRFIVDVDLGELAEHMRALGIDVYFNPAFSRNELIEKSKKEKRIILTKDRALLKLGDITHGVLVRPGTIEQQTIHILELLNMEVNKVAVFRPYKFKVGQKIHIESGPRKGDWEVVGINEKKVKLRCPISSKEFEWDRFCYFVDERDDIKWPSDY